MSEDPRFEEATPERSLEGIGAEPRTSFGPAGRLAEIRARLAAATPGPWRWFGNSTVKSVYLATVHGGRRYVMGFARWGMGAAQPVFQVREADGFGVLWKLSELDGANGPQFEVNHRRDFRGIGHPDAVLIEHAPADLAFLLEHIAKLEARP